MTARRCANASRRKAMSYARLTEKQKVLADEVSALLADADAFDDAEDARFGKDKRGDELPPELARRELRLVKLAEARAALEADAAVRAPKAQRNFTDPDSRIMKTADGSFHYAYNAQDIVDADHQIIVATTLTNIGVDVEQVVPMLEKLEVTTGVLPGQILADAGYCSAANPDYAQSVEAGSDGRTEFFIATGRVKHGERVPDVPRGRIPANATLQERMARKLKTKRGCAVYARRKAIVEPVFGQIHTRQGKFVLLRGLEQAAHEWDLIAACHNLMKLHTMHTKALLSTQSALTARPAQPPFPRHSPSRPLPQHPTTPRPRHGINPE